MSGFVGRPPKPTAVKRLEGNPGGRPLNESEPRPPAGVPDPPEWLSETALEEWRRLVPLLVKMRVLTMADRNALAAYCESYSQFVAATLAVRDGGVLVDSYRGGVAKNPAVQVARDALEQMNRWGAKFGLSPADRARLSVDEAPDEDHDADVLRLLSGGA
ncbi:phage terminase small subunit P27 family [Streptomyces sp. NPDC050507]|uniref:phage terminase small subunit P27 family n=1 Tax=Streptomyces sp. NPDC050507 TaxID=3365619 RepID=UPI0037A4C694